MNHTPTPYKELPEGYVNHSVPPMIQVHLTGALYAKQDSSGLITLVYIDGTTESRAADFDMCSEDKCFMDIVSYVQGGRAALKLAKENQP